MIRRSWIIGLVFLAAVFAFLYLVRAVAVPFLLAILLAYFLDPAAGALERRGIGRATAVGTVFAGFLAIAGLLLAFLIPTVKEEFFIVQQSLPRYAEALYRFLPDTALNALGITGREDLQTLFHRALSGARGLSFDMVNQTAGFLTRAFSSTLGFLLAVLGYFIIPVYLFYLLRDFSQFREGALNLVPVRYRETILTLARKIDFVLGGFLRGQITVCLILAALYSLGLALIGVDLAFVVGIISGLAFIVPYLGTLFGIFAGCLLAMVEFSDFLHPAMVIGWFGLVQLIEGIVITPKIVGDRVGLSPLATLLAVLVGGELFGFLGLLLAVPAAAAGKVVLVHFLEHYRGSEFFQGEGPRA